MKTRTLIIGGGLTGLSLAYRLQRAGHDYQLIEARDRFGGRIKSLKLDGHAMDLGPSWIWQGQTRVAALMADLGLEAFTQWSEGEQLFEQSNGDVVRDAGFMSMAGSWRIVGGTSALTDALVATLDPARLHLGAEVTQITKGAQVTCKNGKGFEADRIVIAMPPRLAERLTFAPPLDEAARQNLRAVPTWMAAHAKCVAVYPTPFWRQLGLSGDASSRRGPMVEIHDASPAQAELGALFGFVGIPAHTRAGIGQQALLDAAIAQLVNLFGSNAAQPISAKIEDWSTAQFTATQADAAAPNGHPPYRMFDALRGQWGGKLIFAVTELTSDNGGLIEGALAASGDAANQILGK